MVSECKKQQDPKKHLRVYLDKIHTLAYPLLRWILASNRAYLAPVPDHKKISGMSNHQFYMLTGNPQKEKMMRERREYDITSLICLPMLFRAMKKKSGKGSFYAYVTFAISQYIAFTVLVHSIGIALCVLD